MFGASGLLPMVELVFWHLYPHLLGLVEQAQHKIKIRASLDLGAKGEASNFVMFEIQSTT